MKTQNYRYLLCMAVALLAACSDAGKGKESEEGVATVLPSESNEVTVKVLKRATFEHELVSNGKVTAGAMADLRFETTGVVAHIYVKNGDPVRKGQKLAELDKFRLKNKTAQAKDALEKAELELQDVLIGQGYPVGDASKVPADIMKLARVRSGYDQSLAQYELAAYEEEHATLVAPFDGVVANLFSKPFNEASTSEAFCSIIGTQGMEVDFTVLESELPLIKSGDKVIVTPYSDAGFRQEGRITQPFAPTAVMFQQPRLLPWMAVLDNIALALKAQGVDKRQRHAQARQMALALGLPELSLAQYPAELSGGMQSRVALARALVLAPKLLLMDEPFSALDVGLRYQLHQLLLEQQAASGMAVLLITHDLMEAVRLADDVLVMAPGPGRIVAHYQPAGAALARTDDLVYRCAAELQQHPLVRAAFELPGVGLAADCSLGQWQEVGGGN